jgi:hypothetical protein
MPDTWGAPLQAAYCPNCDWQYLLPQDQSPPQCPHCAQSALEQADDSAGGFNHPPELILPFTVSKETLNRQIEQFAKGIWFAPKDLKPDNLTTRVQPVFLPMWLVDSSVEALWQAEAGFDYEAVSHRDRYDQSGGGWSSQQFTETRVRWEQRVGRLKREYHNVPAPALEEHRTLTQQLGQFNIRKAQGYQPAAVGKAIVRLPNRSTTDAWPNAEPAIRAAAAAECQQASQAQHIRDFRWRPGFGHKNWTLLLLPVYTSYYLDDDNHPQPVLIHGETGNLTGPRRASMKRARNVTIAIVVVAAIIFFISIIIGLAALIMPALLIVAALGAVLAIITGMLAVAPLVIVWQVNRTQAAESRLST